MSDPFEDLSQLVEGMKAIATMNRACYNAHCEAGFSPGEALKLTADAMTITMRIVMSPILGTQANQPPQ